MTIERLGDVHATSLRAPTRRKLVELGLAEIHCSSCGCAGTADAVTLYHRIAITDRGRKYLTNWRRAYGAGAAA